MSELYTNSRLKVLRECMRLHHYKYVLNIRTPATAVMDFGTIGHAALEAWLRAWKRNDLDARLPEALAAIETSHVSPHDKARLSAIIGAYHCRWGSQPWEILEVEIEFRYDLGGYLIGGKIDGIIRDTRDGRVWLLEHKTTGQDASAGGTYWSRLALDSQISIYVDGGTMLGYEIAGCIYDVLQRPKHEPKVATPIDERKFTLGKGCAKCGGSAKPGSVEKGRGYYIVSMPDSVEHIQCDGCAGTGWKLNKEGEPEVPRLHANQRDTDETVEEFADRVTDVIAADPDDFLIRGEVVRLDDELPAMRQDLLDTIKIERAAALLEVAPRNPDACAKYGRLCDFFGPCSGTESIDDPIRFPRSQQAHPELAVAA